MPPLLLAIAAVLRASAPAASPAPGAAARAHVPRVEEYRLKAEFIERFTHFVRWPERSVSERPGSPFELCVLGDDPFGDSLEAMARGHRVEDHPIELRHPRTVHDVASCSLLFIAASEGERLDQVLATAAGHGVLTVGDSDGFAGRGVIINLYVAEQKIGFEVNQEAARREGFELSAKLLKLARLVGGSGGRS